MRRSELDKINGIGNTLKSRLMKKFKNISSIKKATPEELMTVEGINEKIIQEILKKFKND